MLGTGSRYSDMVLPVNDALVVKAQWDVTYCRNSLVEKQYGDDWENDLSTITPLCQEFAAATASPAPGSPTAMAWIGDAARRWIICRHPFGG